jgi:heat-inducible transcriptional repressor
MAKGTGDREGLDLGPREAEILKSVIRAHVMSGEPVGSKSISRGRGLDLSPATIRNIMAELEERGLLRQPHPSAGRVPTDRGYRIYVDQLMGRRRMAQSQAQVIDQALIKNRGEIPDLLEEASRQLSNFSGNVGVVLAPELRRIVVEHIEFVRLGAQRVVAILVGRSGLVHNRILDVDEPVDQSELDRVGRYLTEQFGGRTLPEIRRALLERISEDRAAYDRLLARTLRLGQQAVAFGGGGADVFVEGASNLVGSPEFSDPDRMQALFRALEQKWRLVDLLGRVLEGEGVQVVIGEENPVTGLSDCSLVASSYGSGRRVMGTVGIVGPTRMEYARAVALVEYLARVLSGLLSGSDQ